MGKQFAQNGGTPEKDNTVGKALNYIINKFIKIYIINLRKGGVSMVRKTHEQFISQMRKINENIEILTEYEKDNIKVKCKCKVCDFEWESTPSNLLQGKGCKQCHFNKLKISQTKSHEQFVSELFRINKNIKVLSEYSGAQNKVDCECLIHNRIFSMSATHLLGGETGCRECIDTKLHLGGLKSHNQFVKELLIINDNVSVVGEYVGAKSRVEVRCLKCGHIWNPVADSLLHGYGCPCCKRSKGEEKIEKYLISNNIEFEPQKKFSNLRNTLPLSYDFYLPEYNLLIEYQGQFHDGNTSMVIKEKYFDKQQKNDKLKKDYAKNNGHNFLEIWYYDFNNVESIIDKFIYNLKNPVTTTAI
jgi:hypothetical protein